MFKISLLALLLLVFSVHTMDNNLIAQDTIKLYHFITRDTSGRAALAFYTSKNISVVEKLPGYIKDSKVINNSIVKASDVDRAIYHGAHDFLLNNDIKEASTSSGVSLALSALWNTADRFGLSKYIYTDSDILNALVYGFIHSTCLFLTQEQLKKIL